MLQSALLCNNSGERGGILRYLKTSTCCAFPKASWFRLSAGHWSFYVKLLKREKERGVASINKQARI